MLKMVARPWDTLSKYLCYSEIGDPCFLCLFCPVLNCSEGWRTTGNSSPVIGTACEFFGKKTSISKYLGLTLVLAFSGYFWSLSPLKRSKHFSHC